MTERWPELDYERDRPVVETLHAYLQVLGKLPTRALPWCNHGWQLALRVVPRGFRTYPIEMESGEAELLFDCLSGHIEIQTSTGKTVAVALAGRSVSEMHSTLSAELCQIGVSTDITGSPNEVENAVPFARDTAGRPWNLATVQRVHRAFADTSRVFEKFRTGFVGKSSPSHLFWGSFDLAVTRFSGRVAPLHPGGVPNLPDAVTREAYSHEVASAGFWLGGGGVDQAAFYAYGYPVPHGLAARPVTPAEAYWHDQLGEFVLPYAVVQKSGDAEGTLLEFLESTYQAVADAGGWPRDALEIPGGLYGAPYNVEALRSRRR